MVLNYFNIIYKVVNNIKNVGSVLLQYSLLKYRLTKV